MELPPNPHYIVEVVTTVGGSFLINYASAKNCKGDDSLLKGVFLASDFANNDNL